MKKIVSLAFVASLLLLGMSACKKQMSQIYLESSDPVTLTASSTNALVLTKANEAQTALSLRWNNPNYRLSTGISSQDVTYSIEIDTAGANFGSANKQVISVAKDLSTNITVKDLNAALLKMNLVENMRYGVDFRVKATLANGSAPVFSNAVRVNVTPYLDVAVEVPASGTLYITGSATPASWMGGGDPELISQKFTRLSSSEYQLTIRLSANNSFLFVPVYGNWSNKYGFDGANNSNNVLGDKFKKEGGDMKAPPETANYRITVNFKTGTYSVVKL